VPVSYVYSFVNGKDNPAPSDVLSKYWSYNRIVRRPSYGEQVNAVVAYNYRRKIPQQHITIPLASTRIIVVALVMTNLASDIMQVVLMIQLVHHVVDRAAHNL
jgi:hypothetical protein